MPLVRRSLGMAAEAFATAPEKIFFTPNCTAGMKSVLETLLSSPKKYRQFAYLTPIYGATDKLLNEYIGGYLSGLLSAESADTEESNYRVQAITLGLFEESSTHLTRILDQAYASKPF